VTVLNRLEEFLLKSVPSHQPVVTSLVELVSDGRIHPGTAAVVGIEMEMLKAHGGRVISASNGGGKKQ
jgi:hypothetical protein